MRMRKTLMIREREKPQQTKNLNLKSLFLCKWQLEEKKRHFVLLTWVNHRGRPQQEMHLSEHTPAAASILSLPSLMDVWEFRKVQMDNGQTPFSSSRVISWRSLNYTFAADLRRRSCRLSEACQRAAEKRKRRKARSGKGWRVRLSYPYTQTIQMSGSQHCLPLVSLEA